MKWVAEELETINLGDERRNRRAIRLMEQLAQQTTGSIPTACAEWSQTQAVYRFLGNEAFDWQDLLAPHWRCTEQRMAQQPVVLCLQDTTELNFNGQQIKGLGPLSYEHQRGMYLHTTYIVTPERAPLGVFDAWMWARQPKDKVTGQRPADIPESERWKDGYLRVVDAAKRLPDTRLVYVADREADIVDWMSRAEDLGHPADWLVRAKHNRVLPDQKKLWPTVLEERPLGQVSFTLPSGRGRKARSVVQALYAKQVQIRRNQSKNGGTITVTCLIAREIDAPAGVKPIEWRLLTSLPTASSMGWRQRWS